MILEYLKEDNLIICPNFLKKSVIKEINNSNTLISYKIMSLEEFKEKYFFTYSKKTIYYLMSKLNLKLEIVLEYLDSMYYLEDKKYNSQKLNDLVLLKKELMDNNLLDTNHVFLEYLKNTNIILYGYDEVDPFYEKIFNKYLYQKVNLKNNPKKLTVYEFETIEEEINYVCHDIKNKLDTGVLLSNIKLIVSSDEYQEPLKRIFKWCHLPIEINNKKTLYDLPVGKFILNSIKNNKNFADIISELNESDEIKNIVISLFNQYVELETDVKNLLEMIKYDLKHTYLKEKHNSNTIEIVTFFEIKKEDYVYVLGFNQENYPTIYKDEEFLSDNLKLELGLFTSNQKNINSIKTLKNNMYSNNNIIFTYKNRDFFNTYNPCILIQEEKMEVITNPKFSYNLSNFFNQISLAKEYDKFYKYGIHSYLLDDLGNNYKNIKYRSYNNQFTGLSSNSLLSSLNNTLTLSYSSLDIYYRCAFSYYVNHILKIKEEYSDDFYMNIGNVFHYVLANMYKDNFDFEKCWTEAVNEYNFNTYNMVILEKLKEELKYDIEILKKQLNYTCFDKYLYEEPIDLEIPNSKNIMVNFTGKLDKICSYQYNDKTLVSIVDYKTGTLHSNLNNIIYGINMQLPIYMYLIKNKNLFKNPVVVGFYLQQIINKDIKKEINKDVSELKEKALKLVGYSIDNCEYLEKFDNTYPNSALIQGLKTKNDGGFYSTSKVLSEEKLKKLEKLVDEKIKNGVEEILNANFLINPKKVDKENLGCKNCHYKDICFMKNDNIVKLDKHKNLDFLGGE